MIEITMVEPTVALYGPSYDQTVEVLDEVIRESGARYALLLDRKGFVLAHRRALWASKPPPLDSLATLVANNAAAIQALAKILGETQFQEQVHQGKDVGLFLEETGSLALLVIIFDSSAPLGRIKLFGKRAAKLLAKIAAEATVAPDKLGIDSEYSEGASALLDDLFGTSS